MVPAEIFEMINTNINFIRLVGIFIFINLFFINKLSLIPIQLTI